MAYVVERQDDALPCLETDHADGRVGDREKEVALEAQRRGDERIDRAAVLETGDTPARVPSGETIVHGHHARPKRGAGLATPNAAPVTRIRSADRHHTQSLAQVSRHLDARPGIEQRWSQR